VSTVLKFDAIDKHETIRKNAALPIAIIARRIPYFATKKIDFSRFLL